MKQVLQDIRSGETLLADVPGPSLGDGQVLIRTSASLISLGTEKMLLDFGRAGWLDKARQQPDKVRQVLAKVRTDGLFSTLEAVQNKLDQPIPLGYCNVGVVEESRAAGLISGTRVVSNGGHAEQVAVGTNLCAPVPNGVSDEQASFTVLGAIALQGIRLLNPTLGESMVVMGLGLIGQLAVQLLRANGCRVFAVDLDEDKCRMARTFGAEAVVPAGTDALVNAARTWSGGEGVDGVLVTAATSSSELMHQAAQMCRKRGRIVLTGVAGLQLQRSDFYEKELSLQVSCSYGPGRYDPFYEQKGHDYPAGFVRWTENRNFQAFLEMLSSGRINVAPLVSHRFSIDQATQAYEQVAQGRALGILLEYAGKRAEEKIPRTIQFSSGPPAPSVPVVGVIGAGGFTSGVLLPALKDAGVRIKYLAARTGTKAAPMAQKFSIEICTTDVSQLLNDDQVNVVVVSTRHDSHADLAVQVLQAGKHVFVEKPLGISHEQLDRVKQAYEEASASGLQLMVGFNRRFSPHIQRVKEALSMADAPKAMVMTVNAGQIPLTHWVQDAEQGGGRVIGEGCHFVDLLLFLAGCPVVKHHAVYARDTAATRRDVVSLHLSFADGSIGTIHYFANGSRMFMKERLEVFCEGGILQMNNFRHTRGFRWPGLRSLRTLKQEKGHRQEIAACMKALRDGSPSPIPFEELLAVSRLSIDLAAD